MRDNLIPVFLTPEQAALFALFQQHYEPIAYMLSQGAFDIKRGDVTVHFDKDGQISSIERRLFSYPSKKVV